MIDARRHMMLVGATTNEKWHRTRGCVARSHGPKLSLHLQLACMARQVNQILQADIRRDIGKQIIYALNTDVREH